MAASTLTFFKCPASLIFLRCLKDSKHSLGPRQYSTCRVLNSKQGPVKYSASPAAKLTIGETTGMDVPPENKWKKFIVVSSLAVFLFYFCVLREENDLDEILSGKSMQRTEEMEMIDLKLKLAYCERNNLPTTNIKLKMDELIQKNARPVFPK